MSLGLLRPGRFVAAHVAAVLVALAVGLATDHLLAALAAAGLFGVLAHVGEQARQRLRSDALERRYRQLVEDMPLSFYITSIDSSPAPLYVSPAIVDLLGYPLDEWKADPLLFEKIVHPLDSERVRRALARAKAEMHPYEAEYRLYHKNGSVVWVQDHAVSVRETRGGRFHWQGFLVDVTARKQAEARYRTLVEQLPLVTYIDTPYSSDEAASYVSPQIEQILGYSLEEWHANPSFFVEHLHPEDRERVRDAQRQARLNAEPLELDYRIIAADGRVVWLNDSYTVVRDEAGKPWYTQGFAVDVTARKQAEHDREALLTQAQEQNERLRKLDRMKDEFIALVSHELRTPLTSICGYLELLLQDDVMAELPAAQLNWLEVIDRNAERLLRLVEDLLLTAQASAGNLALEQGDLDIAAIIGQAVQACGPVAAARGITLTCSTDTLPPASGDRLRIGQVIDNLISNALKFTPSGGTRRGTCISARLCCADRSCRHGHGHLGGGADAALRAVLPHGACPGRSDPGRRARALDLEGDRRSAQRADLRPQRRGSRHDVLRRSAGERAGGCRSSPQPDATSERRRAPGSRGRPPRGRRRLRERRPGQRGRGHLERVARVARAPARPAFPELASARSATGSSRGRGSTGASRTRAPRSRRSARSGRCCSASRWAAPSRRRSPTSRRSRRVLGLAPWFPDRLSLEPLRGRRLACCTARSTAGCRAFPGVSPASSRRGFERARRSASKASTRSSRARCTALRCARTGDGRAAAARAHVGALVADELRAFRPALNAAALELRGVRHLHVPHEPSFSRPRITHHETSICQRCRPCRAEAGNAWWLLCQPSPKTSSATSQLLRAWSRER